MKWRYVSGVMVVLLFAGVRAAIGIPQSIPPVAVYDGHVDVATAPDGRLLILVDVNRPHRPPDGLVEQSFRLQGAPALSYSGPGRVIYVKTRVSVEIGRSAGWVFTVAGRPMPPADVALTSYDVSGIAHIWGRRFHQAPATVMGTLSTGSCSAETLGATPPIASAAAGGCQDCAAGGEGSSSCSMDGCPDGSTCSADCMDGTFACCNCGGGCSCCTPREGGWGHH